MRHSVWIALVALMGCGQLGLSPEDAPRDALPSDAQPELAPEFAAPPPPPTARTAEQFDTTSAAQRAEAAATPATAAGAQSLGVTVASLGDPARSGFWMDTPLVSEPQAGRVVYQGQSANVSLQPIDGPATAGSRLSLSAMRLIGVPLTDLAEVEVFLN